MLYLKVFFIIITFVWSFMGSVNHPQVFHILYFQKIYDHWSLKYFLPFFSFYGTHFLVLLSFMSSVSLAPPPVFSIFFFFTACCLEESNTLIFWHTNSWFTCIHPVIYLIFWIIYFNCYVFITNVSTLFFLCFIVLVSSLISLSTFIRLLLNSNSFPII